MSQNQTSFSWEYQPEEWNLRQPGFQQLWFLPAFFTGIFFLLDLWFSYAGFISKSGRYEPPHPFNVEFWVWTVLIVGPITLLLWQKRPANRPLQKPGCLVVFAEGIWLIDGQGNPEKVWEADLPRARGALLSGVSFQGLNLSASFLLPGTLGSAYEECVYLPVAARGDILEPLKQLNQSLKSSYPERASKLASQTLQQVAVRHWREQIYAAAALKPGGFLSCLGCPALIALSFFSLMACMSVVQDLARYDFSVADLWFWLYVLLAVCSSALLLWGTLQLRRSKFRTLLLRLSDDTLWLNPKEGGSHFDSVSLSTSREFYAQGDKVLTSSASLVLRDLPAQTATDLAEALNQAILPGQSALALD